MPKYFQDKIAGCYIYFTSAINTTSNSLSTIKSIKPPPTKYIN